MNYKSAIIKRNLELAGMFPFVLLGKIAGKIFKLKTKHSVFLFYSWADIGGSIQVNVDIANSIKDAKPIIFFSKKPRNNQFRDRFDIEGVRIIDIHKYIDNKLYHFVNFFFRGLISSWINEAENPVIFGGECMFLYKIVPHVKKETVIGELNHYNAWFNYTQEFVKDIDYRIFSTPQIKRDAERQYKTNNVPEKYYKNLYFIDNTIEIPPYVPVNNPVLEVLFVGRGSPQKRVHIAAKIAQKMNEAGKKINFSFVGDVEKFIPEEAKQYCKLYGSITDKNIMNDLYFKSDVLLLTSLYEGLPLVIMEMMARGRVVVSTAIDGIPDYIKHMENGFLLTEKDEDKIVSQGVEYLSLLLDNKELREKLGQKSYQEAIAHFGKDKFVDTYRSILLQNMPELNPPKIVLGND